MMRTGTATPVLCKKLFEEFAVSTLLAPVGAEAAAVALVGRVSEEMGNEGVVG